MGLVSSLRRAFASQAPARSPRVELDLVGESYRQDALERLCGGRTEDSAQFRCTASLIAEPDNPHDPLAVKVVVDGHHVGYLKRGTTRAWHQRALREGPINCEAMIVGGWDRGSDDRGHFGIRVWAPS